MITPDEIAGIAVFAGLTQADRERLARVAADVSLVEGEYAAYEGSGRALFGLMSGRIEAVMVRDGAPITAEELKAFCLEKGPAYSHPRFIDIVPALPLNGAGKVDRGIIQARLVAAHGAASKA